VQIIIVQEQATTIAAPFNQPSEPDILQSSTAEHRGFEATALRLIAQLSTDLASTATLEAGVNCCLAVIEQCFAPTTAQLVWGSPPRQQVFGFIGHQIHQPAPDIVDKLAAGQIMIHSIDEQSQDVWLPLMARQMLAGWIVFQHSAAWNETHRSVAIAIAAQASAALSMIEMMNHRDERVTQLQTLATVGQHISGTLDLDALLESIYTATSRVISARDFFIALNEPDTGTLDLAYIIVDGERRHLHDRWSTRLGLGGLVLRERQPILTDDYLVECDRRGVAPYPIAGLPVGHAWIGVPLIARDQVVGIMTASSRNGHRYQAEHVDLLTTIASQAAVAIENARLYRRSEHQARQLTILNRIGRTITSWLDFEQIPSAIMDQVTRLLEVEEGSLLLTEEPSGDLVFAYTTGPVGNQLRGLRLPRGTGIAGYVITSGQSIIVNDAQRDGRFDSTTDRSTGYTTRRMLAVPLRGLSGALGVIEVINRRDNSPFTDEDRRLLEALADYAVIAIENARRFAQVDQALARRAQDLVRINDQLQHNLRSLTALNALGMAINTSLRSPDEIYRMTTRGVVEMTGALGAWMLLRHGNEWRVAITVGPTLSDEQTLIPQIRHVAETGRPELVTKDLPQAITKLGTQALLIVPMRATRETLGYLCVGYADNPPDAPERETVVLFATQAASSVESMLLFSAVSSARDQMASVLASTREGIMLVGADRRVAVVNARLRELCELHEDPTGQTLEQFLANWEQEAGLFAEEWQVFQRGFGAAVDRQEAFVSGEIGNQRGRVLEWAAIRALSSGDSHGGALLVLRDITEAKESEKLRQDLTHMIVHDLRSPLSSVMASIEMLMRGVTGEMNGGQQHVLSIANDSSQQMLAMINTLLDISRLEAGRMPLSLAAIDVCPLIERAVSQMASLAHDRGIILATNFEPATPMAHADAALTVRVAQNLIANAIKFSGRSGVVTVMVGPSPDGILVCVRDQGIGIAPKDRDKIFAKFGQVGERRGGTGLGLTFCKLVIEAHNGRIWVDSQVGAGSTFSFILPAIEQDPTTYNRTSSPS